MFESMVKLPAVVSSVWNGVRKVAKRRQVKTNTSLFAIEALEMRQLLSAANGLGNDEDFTPRIINGTTTPSTDFLAVGQLTFTPTGGSAIRSSGTLITDRWVLTSASASNQLTQAGGTASVVLNGVTYAVDQVVPYGKATSGTGDYKQDIALWHLTTAVPGTVTPIDVSFVPPAAKSTVTIVGFGAFGTVDTGSDGTYGTKRHGTNTVDRLSPSLLTWKYNGNTEANSAVGDTGGPVLQSFNGVLKVVGVASHHSLASSAKNDNAFSTRVDVYAGWIDNTIGRAHPTTTAVDDNPNIADTIGTSNKTYTFTSSKKSFEAVGAFQSFGDVDVFKIVIPADAVMTIDLVNASPTTKLLDPKLEIVSSDGTTVLFTNDDLKSSNLNSQLIKTLAAGTYFLRVSGYSDAQIGGYRLSMKAKYTGGTTSTTPDVPTVDLSAIAQLTFTAAGGTPVFSSGTLISSQWILTSAGASNNLNLTGNTATVRLGGVTYTVNQIVKYSKFNDDASGDFRQDLALWHITTAVPGTITPLAISTTPPAAGSTVIVAGLGGTALVSGSPVYDTIKSINNKVDRVAPGQLVWKLEQALELTNAAGDTGGAILKSVNGVLQIVGVSAPLTTTPTAIGQNAFSTRTDLYIGWIEDTLGVAHTVSGSDDYNNTVATSNKTVTLTATKPSVEVLGKLHAFGDVDMIKIVVQDAGFVTFSLANQTPATQLLDTTMQLIGTDGTTVLATSDDVSRTDLGCYIGKSLAAGTYYISVAGYASQQKGSYRLTSTNNIDNVGNTAATAKVLTPNLIGTVSSNVVINSSGDYDYFKFTTNVAGKYQFDFIADDVTTFDPVIEVFAANGTTSLGRDDDSGADLNARLTLSGLTTATVYYIKVSGYNVSTGSGVLTARKIGA